MESPQQKPLKILSRLGARQKSKKNKRSKEKGSQPYQHLEDSLNFYIGTFSKLGPLAGQVPYKKKLKEIKQKQKSKDKRMTATQAQHEIEASYYRRWTQAKLRPLENKASALQKAGNTGGIKNNQGIRNVVQQNQASNASKQSQRDILFCPTPLLKGNGAEELEYLTAPSNLDHSNDCLKEQLDLQKRNG